MKSYLVPIDFSSNADRALAAARTIARHTGVHLYILHAYQPYWGEVTLGGESLPAYNDLENTFRKDLETHADNLRKEGFSAEAIWAVGQVAEVVKEKVEELKPQLIIIGRTGKGGFLDKLFGTAASDIVKAARVPVLIVPPQADPKEFKEVVYATQLEYEERHIISRILKLSRETGGRVTFLKVNALTQPNIQDDQQFIKEITDDFDLSDDDFVIKDAGSVVGGIEQFAEEMHADLLVVSTRSRGILEKLFIDPSITARLIVRSAVPLLIYHLD